MRIDGLAGSQSITGSQSKVQEGDDFKKMLFQEIEKVNQTEAEAKAAAENVVTGDAESIHDAMVASVKAEMTLDFAIQVNNKAIEAYKEVMRTQL